MFRLLLAAATLGIPGLLAVAAATFAPPADPAGFLPTVARPAHPERIASLVAAAKDAHSDALLVVRNGRVEVERYADGRPRKLLVMSITKAVSSLAIGMLLDDGKIPSVDVPMSTYCPAWRTDPRKARVTLRHVLTHTSGVGHTMRGGEIARHPDWVAFAAGLPAEDEPGTHWAYNNAVSQLMSEVVRQASGERIDRFLDRRLFQPLGIRDWSWERDPAGHPDTAGGLALWPRDLARIGLLMLDRGRWHGQQLLSEAFVAQATTPQLGNPVQGLIWRLSYPEAYLVQTPTTRATLREHGLSDLVDRLEPLDGRHYALGGAYAKAMARIATAEEAKALGALDRAGTPWFEVHQEGRRCLGHDGWLGQYLVVDPGRRLVAVRLRHDPGDVPDREKASDGFGAFTALVEHMADP